MSTSALCSILLRVADACLAAPFARRSAEGHTHHSQRTLTSRPTPPVCATVPNVTPLPLHRPWQAGRGRLLQGRDAGFF